MAETWDDVTPPIVKARAEKDRLERTVGLRSLTTALKQVLHDKGGYRRVADNIEEILDNPNHPHFVNMLRMAWDRLEGKVADKLDMNVQAVKEGIVLRHGRLDAPLPLPGGPAENGGEEPQEKVKPPTARPL